MVGGLLIFLGTIVIEQKHQHVFRFYASAFTPIYYSSIYANLAEFWWAGHGREKYFLLFLYHVSNLLGVPSGLMLLTIRKHRAQVSRLVFSNKFSSHHSPAQKLNSFYRIILSPQIYPIWSISTCGRLHCSYVYVCLPYQSIYTLWK